MQSGITADVRRRGAHRSAGEVRWLSARNIRYILTPEGMNELAHRSYHYMRRTFTEVRECAAAGAADTLKALGCVSMYEVAEREEKE